MTYPPQDLPAEPAPPVPQLRCPLCDNTTFSQEESRQDSRWGWTTHRMTLLICQRCRYVLHFYDSNSIWDFE